MLALLFAFAGTARAGIGYRSPDCGRRERYRSRIDSGQAKLWWPNGHGSQPLYDLETRLEDTESGTRLDSRTTRFGVREIRWGQVEGAPEDFINPYRLIINGRTVRMMGCGMLATDVLYGRMGDRVPRLVHLAKVLGINTMRMNGAGIVLPDEFYSLADELGIMVSQEFPLANTWPEVDTIFLGNLESTVRNIIRQLRNHPSIIEWGGGNEMPWQQGTDHTALDLLERVCAQEDTSRIFRATDPMQGSKHSPWDYEPRTHYNHYNSILPFAPIPEKSLATNSMFAMRYGEFGTSGPANIELFQREIPPSSQWPLKPDDPVLIRKHVLQAVDNATWWMKPQDIRADGRNRDNDPRRAVSGRGRPQVRVRRIAEKRQADRGDDQLGLHGAVAKRSRELRR